MKCSKLLLTSSALCVLLLTACGKSNTVDVKPLLGLEWFAGYDDVKERMDSLTLISEREGEGGNISQKMLDYSGAELYDVGCDLTLCFTDSGLVGFNYHDVDRSQNYKKWYASLETNYGLPTEQGSGMAVWYDSPLGKDTAVYLFNLQEGVQVSFYATADSPDKDYEKQREEFVIPTPEIRTPVVPVIDEPSPVTTAAASTEYAPMPTTISVSGIFREGDIRLPEVIAEDIPEEDFSEDVTGETVTGEAVTGEAGETVSTSSQAVTTMTGSGVTTSSASQKTTAAAASATTSTTARTTSAAPVTTAAAATTEPPKTTDEKKAFLLNGLKFYGSPDSQRKKMSRYTQLYEYRSEEPGQPWELIMEYENVPYMGKNCESVLCFTSLGLVGISYLDPNPDNYSYWEDKLTGIYGSPDETQFDYAVWDSSPVGNGTMIYVFALSDGVQVSFFTDDTGSEVS